MRRFAAVALASLLAACGSTTTEAPAGASPEAAAAADAPEAPPPPADFEMPHPDANVAFQSPADGAKVSSPVAVKMHVNGFVVKPAGQLEKGTGHHHIIVDGTPVDTGMVVPKDDRHIHFGDGSTETQLKLSPGEHSLTLQFADGMHRSYGPTMAQTIQVTVAEGAPGEDVAKPVEGEAQGAEGDPEEPVANPSADHGDHGHQ